MVERPDWPVCAPRSELCPDRTVRRAAARAHDRRHDETAPRDAQAPYRSTVHGSRSGDASRGERAHGVSDLRPRVSCIGARKRLALISGEFGQLAPDYFRLLSSETAICRHDIRPRCLQLFGLRYARKRDERRRRDENCFHFIALSFPVPLNKPGFRRAVILDRGALRLVIRVDGNSITLFVARGLLSSSARKLSAVAIFGGERLQVTAPIPHPAPRCPIWSSLYSMQHDLAELSPCVQQ